MTPCSRQIVMAAGFNDTAPVYNMDDTCPQCRVDVMGLERLFS